MRKTQTNEDTHEEQKTQITMTEKTNPQQQKRRRLNPGNKGRRRRRRRRRRWRRGMMFLSRSLGGFLDVSLSGFLGFIGFVE